MMAPMRCIQYSVASQYGTHVDAPRHFHEKGRTMAEIGVNELVFPLVVIDKSAECAANPDFMLKVEDIQKWEEQYGRIPEGAFVAFRSDWYKKANLDNPDENGQPHYPRLGRRGHQVARRKPQHRCHWPRARGHRPRLRHHQGGRLSLPRRAVHTPPSTASR